MNIQEQIPPVLINTVNDLINVLEKVINKETIVDSLRIDPRCPQLTMFNLSTGELVTEQVPVIYEEYEIIDIDFVLSETLTVGKLIWILQQVPKETFIYSIRLKAASNGIYVAIDTNGLVICD